MNKKIRGLIAFSLVTANMLFTGGSNSFFATAAYASSDDADEIYELDIEDSDGNSIDLYSDDDYEDEVDDDLDEGDTYYAESDTSKITINNDDVDDDYVRIIYDSDVYELGDSIKLKDGTNTIKVRVYDEEYDEDETYSSSDYTQFTLKVKYDGDSEEDSDDASSDDEDLSDTSVNSTDTSLNESSITQTITTAPTAPTADTIQSTDYVTSTASVLNNGWKYINNSWYYYYSDGTMASGWILSGGSWYYLDSTGKMLTGWFKDQDGSWYYLYESGAMAADTTIDGYKVGPSGAWIK